MIAKFDNPDLKCNLIRTKQ